MNSLYGIEEADRGALIPHTKALRTSYLRFSIGELINGLHSV
jgi:hypothetical protein